MRIHALAALLWAPIAQGAVINGYGEVIGIAGAVLTVGSSDESAGQFLAGGKLVLIQMQDDVIGANTGNNASFGNIGSIQMAGYHVECVILSVARSGGILTSITLSTAPPVTFNTGPNSAVQVVTIARPGGAGNFTTTQQMDALAWDGTLGGVVAVEVPGIFTLQHNISAISAGFRGGIRTTAGGATCNTSNYIIAGGSATYAGKGEGIYKLTNNAWVNARGHIANGGGGGNSHNGGGGGGSNYSVGGLGGPGYTCAATPAGGLGGVSLASYSGMSRLFMGGGGGGGEGNNNASTSGGRGGGIVMIWAGTLRTTGSCAGRTISANGANATTTSGNDGAGGAGGAGSIFLQVTTYDIAPGCSLTVRANGGNGGGVDHVDAHGGGGGGGQGAIILSGSAPPPSVTTQTNSGSGGCNNNSVPCASQAGSGGGPNGAGILFSSGPLPVELLYLSAQPEGRSVRVDWGTATEHDNALFLVERSADGTEWTSIGSIPGAGSSQSVIAYSWIDQRPLYGFSYYRLRQTDLDGHSRLSHVVAVHMGQVGDLIVVPNPASSSVRVYLSEEMTGEFQMMNELGQVLQAMPVNEGLLDLDVSGLPAGVYLLSVTSDRMTVRSRLVVRH